MKITKQLEYTTIKPVAEILIEWEDLIQELSQKEVALFQWRECYQIKSEEIIAETDFKELYGKNNEGIRKQHVRNELPDWYDTIKELEFSISYLERRISFLRGLVAYRTVLEENTGY